MFMVHKLNEQSFCRGPRLFLSFCYFQSVDHQIERPISYNLPMNYSNATKSEYTQAYFKRYIRL